MNNFSADPVLPRSKGACLLSSTGHTVYPSWPWYSLPSYTWHWSLELWQ